MPLMSPATDVISQQNRLLVRVVWVFFLVNQVKYLFDTDLSLLVSGVGFMALVVATLLTRSRKYAVLAMYSVILLLIIYTTVLLIFSPHPVNLLFIWLSLLVSALYGQYEPVLLTAVLSLGQLLYFFPRIQPGAEPALEPIDLFYVVLFWLFATILLLLNIRHRKLMEARIDYVASHDYLTRLPNRALFQKLAAPMLARARRYEQRLAVLYMDLDGFKKVNDRTGHSAGDQLLQEVAAALHEQLRENDVLARFGGDEFVAVAEIKSTQDARIIAQRLVESARAAAAASAVATPVTLSVGVSLYPDHGGDLGSLLQAADRALYRGKARGGDGWHMYSESLANASLSGL